MEAISVKPNNKKVLIKEEPKGKHLTKSEVKQMIKSSQMRIMEPKSFDVGLFVSAGNGGTATLNKLTTITQGDTDLTRDGDQLYVEWFETRYNALVNTTDVSNLVRVMFFIWHFDDNANPPTASLILQNSTTPYSSYNRDSVKQKAFTMLSDRMHSLYTGGVGHECVYFRSKKKFKITYTSGGTTGKNNIYGLFVSDSSVSPFPTVSSYSRTQFLDA